MQADVSFVLPDGVPALVRAASLALGVTQMAKCGSWAELRQRANDDDPDVLGHLGLLAQDPEDVELLDKFDAVLRLTAVKPLTTVAVCAECLGWTLVSGQGPTTCRFENGCVGKPIKASRAPRRKNLEEIGPEA